MHNKLTHPLVLTPRTNALAKAFLGRKQLVSQLIASFGSPLNILLPQAIAGNVKSFTDVLTDHKVTGKLFFAHKANQSDSLLTEMSSSAVNCDVASIEELRHALACGFTGSRLEATGPKSLEFLRLCLMHGVTINVDSIYELLDIVSVQQALKSSREVPILIRLSNFTAKESRFGISLDEARHVLQHIIIPQKKAFRLLGFSFHLDSTSVDERIDAISNCLLAFEQAVSLGLEPRVLNIGGGFGINYLKSKDEWDRYVLALKEAALGKTEDPTWNNNFFGLSAEGGTLRGRLNTYSYHHPLPGSDFLNELLNSRLPSYQNQRLSDVLRNNQIELWLEPGRALLDLAGLTLACVSGIKGMQDHIVGLEMKRQDIAFLDQEIFVDPILIDAKYGKRSDYSGYFLAGNLCLESDLIFRRKVFLPVSPDKGDIFAFINTAAYMMDFSTTNSIMQGQAARIAVVQGDKQFHWMLDEKYSPVWQLH